MKNIMLLSAALVLLLQASAQDKYSSVGGIETPYKDKYKFTVKLDEKTNKLTFETDAPVSVVTLETYTPAELAVRKGKEYTDTYTKSGNKYSYDLKKPLLRDQYAYWLKVSIGRNGIPLAEYFFRKNADAAATTEQAPTTDAGEEEKKDDGATIIRTNIKCAAGKTKVMNALKALDGVTDVKIDITTGKLTIVYSTDGTPYTGILSAINEQGFEADGQKTTAAASNPCKGKTKN